MYENSSLIGTRYRGATAPSIILASGSELNLKFVSQPLGERYRDDEDLDEVFRKIGGFRGFRIRIDAEKGNDFFGICIDKSHYIS